MEIQLQLIICYIIYSSITYRIVASTKTCYYSENQIFCFLKSQILTRQFFFLGKNLFCLSLDLLDIPATWQTHHVFVK